MNPAPLPPLKVKEGQEVALAQQLVEWDPFSFSILTEEAGGVAFKDILDKQTVAEHVDENTGLSALVIMDSPDEKKQPRIEIKGDEGKSRRRYLLPSGSHLMVQDGQTVDAGDVLVKIPRETAKQKDITGGLPRVVDLFEARRPKEPAVITEVNGLVKFGDVVLDLSSREAEARAASAGKMGIARRGVCIGLRRSAG